MVDLSILKNPLVIGILAMSVTLLYVWWEEKKRREKNPKAKKRSINFISPVVVGGIAWFIASNYIDNSTNTIQNPEVELVKNNAQKALPQIMGGTKSFVVQNQGSIASEGSLGSASYHIISKRNVRLPPTDVFIDLAKF
jgi:hypothetical protein